MFSSGIISSLNILFEPFTEMEHVSNYTHLWKVISIFHLRCNEVLNAQRYYLAVNLCMVNLNSTAPFAKRAYPVKI